jgi:hypothetical protein
LFSHAWLFRMRRWRGNAKSTGVREQTTLVRWVKRTTKPAAVGEPGSGTAGLSLKVAICFHSCMETRRGGG